MPSELTFAVGPADESPSFGLLYRAVEDIRRLLRDVDYAIYGTKARQEWRLVSLHSSAPTLTIAPNREDKQAVGIIAEGLLLVNNGTDQPPEHFTEPVFEDLKRMKRLFHGRNRAKSIAVLMDDKEITAIEKDIAQKAERVLSAGYHNLGSLQGRLEAINVHSSLSATIWDRVSKTPVRWVFPRGEIERVKSLLEEQVVVMGDIHYFSNGTPRSIKNVVGIEEAEPIDQSVKAGFGSIPDRHVQETGAAEWLRSVRG